MFQEEKKELSSVACYVGDSIAAASANSSQKINVLFSQSYQIDMKHRKPHWSNHNGRLWEN